MGGCCLALSFLCFQREITLRLLFYFLPFTRRGAIACALHSLSFLFDATRAVALRRHFFSTIRAAAALVFLFIVTRGVALCMHFFSTRSYTPFLSF